MDRSDRRHLPAARLNDPVCERNFAGESKQKPDCMIGHFRHAIVGNVGDDDIALARGDEVDVVDAEPRPSDHFATRKLANEVGRNLGVAHHKRVCVASHCENVPSFGTCRHAKARAQRLQSSLNRIH